MWCRDDFEWLSSPSKSQNEQHASPYTLKRFSFFFSYVRNSNGMWWVTYEREQCSLVWGLHPIVTFKQVRNERLQHSHQ
jgi:hypothetical protein